MEFAGNEIFNLARRRRIDICKTVDLRVDGCQAFRATMGGLHSLLRLAHDESKSEHKLIVVIELQNEVGKCAGNRRIDILREI